jgi:hypothetical protein
MSSSLCSRTRGMSRYNDAKEMVEVAHLARLEANRLLLLKTLKTDKDLKVVSCNAPVKLTN